MTIRSALPAECKALEALQWRASLGNEGDRDALLRHPDAIDLPAEQIAAGGSKALHVIGNSHARTFYLSCGFTVTGPFETRFGSALLMRKAL